ncbi:MAG: hypothetical protein JW825_01700 [Candidatus Methanofastidiosa archaeon]|nr:hypothetical protein [Candidatus Methanofastidiosa archaeon]
MHKRFFAVLLILIPLAAVSGCLGGDENIDKWNEIVDKANGYAMTGEDIITEAEDAYDDGYYDLAIQKVDEATDELNLLAYEVHNLMGVAEDMDNGFTEDYVQAWQRKINAGQSYVDNLKMLIYIDMYSMSYLNVVDSQDAAFDYMYDFMDYYNSDQYQQAILTGEMALADFQMLSTYANEMADAAENIPHDYVKQYAATGISLFDNYVGFIQKGLQAASSAEDGDFDSADAYVSEANVFYSNANTAQDALNAIGDNNPGEFPLTGYPLNALFEQYYYALQSDLDNVNMYADEMTDIEDDNSDFFE